MVPLWGFMGAVYSILLTGLSSLLFHYLYLAKYDMQIEAINFIKPTLIIILVLLLYYTFYPVSLIIKIILLIIYFVAISFLIPEAKEIFKQIFKHLFRFKPESHS